MVILIALANLRKIKYLNVSILEYISNNNKEVILYAARIDLLKYKYLLQNDFTEFIDNKIEINNENIYSKIYNIYKYDDIISIISISGVELFKIVSVNNSIQLEYDNVVELINLDINIVTFSYIAEKIVEIYNKIISDENKIEYVKLLYNDKIISPFDGEKYI